MTTEAGFWLQAAKVAEAEAVGIPEAIFHRTPAWQIRAAVVVVAPRMGPFVLASQAAAVLWWCVGASRQQAR